MTKRKKKGSERRRKKIKIRKEKCKSGRNEDK